MLKLYYILNKILNTKFTPGWEFPPIENPWCDARIVAIGRKVRAFPPHVTLYDETKVAVRLQQPPDGTRNYGIIDTKQQPQQN